MWERRIFIAKGTLVKVKTSIKKKEGTSHLICLGPLKMTTILVQNKVPRMTFFGTSSEYHSNYPLVRWAPTNTCSFSKKDCCSCSRAFCFVSNEWRNSSTVSRSLNIMYNERIIKMIKLEAQKCCIEIQNSIYNIIIH